MKKYLAFVLAILLCLSMFSCSKDEGIYESDTVKKAKPDENRSALSVKIEEIKEEYVPKRVSFVAAGDNIVYYGNVLEAASLSSGSYKYDFSHQFQYIKEKIQHIQKMDGQQAQVLQILKIMQMVLHMEPMLHRT